MKRKGILCITICLLLVGCGKEDKLLSYLDTTDIGFVDTAKEAEEYSAGLKREDYSQWVYNQKNIEQFLSLENMLQSEVQKRKCRLSSDGDNLQRLWSRIQKGVRPDGAGEGGVQIAIQSGKREDIEAIAGKIDKMGYSGIANAKFDFQQNIRGVDFSVTDMEDYFELLIQIPTGMLYYPEKYEEILRTFWENGWYAGNLRCYGGALNRIIASNEDKNMLCKSIQISLDQKGKIVEFVGTMDGNGFYKIRSESEKKVLVEILTKLTGDRNEAISFVQNFSRKNKRGTIAGEYNWSVLKEDEMCVLQIQ